MKTLVAIVVGVAVLLVWAMSPPTLPAIDTQPALVLLFGAALYFLPSLVGMHKRNAVAIFMLNLFLGWTLVGWVVALVWACTHDTRQTA